MVASKGAFCLLAFFLLVKSSQQRASEEILDPQRSSSQDAQDSSANERSAMAEANANANAALSMPYRPRPVVPPGLPLCVYEDQVINAVVANDCFVCVCVRRRNNYLEPVCGSCNQCEPVPPPWVTTIRPPPPTTTYRPEVPTCDPLPTNQQFQNPLDPCQICICVQLPDAYGRLSPPIIECQMNPNCKPRPTPPNDDHICNYYPKNVWFKNPNMVCELCSCTSEATMYGPPHARLSCFRDPSCDGPTTIRPITPTTKKDPLPPPLPHESCMPFTPNVPFDHPWDQCQSCVCSEYYRPGIINIEVNCYTKKECCLEYLPPPQIPTLRPPPYFPIGGSGSAYSSAHAEGSGSAIADSSAYVNSLSGQSSAEAAASASANNNYLYSPPVGPNGAPLIVPGHGSRVTPLDDGGRIVYPGNRPSGLIGPLGQNSASANANANANVGGSGLLYPGQYGPGQYGGSAESSASANANVNVGNLPYPEQNQMWPGQSWAEAGANAVANSVGGLNGFNSLTQADSLTQAQLLGPAQLQSNSPLIGSYYPGSYSGGLSQALANANAQALGVGGNSEAAAQAYAALKSGEEEESVSA